MSCQCTDWALDVLKVCMHLLASYMIVLAFPAAATAE